MNSKKLILLVLLCAPVPAAAAPATLSMHISSPVISSAAAIATVSLNTGSGVLGAADFFITFDTGVATLNGVGTVVPQFQNGFYFKQTAPGRLRVLALNGVSASAPAGTVVLATMSFTTSGAAFSGFNISPGLIIDTQPVAYSPVSTSVTYSSSTVAPLTQITYGAPYFVDASSRIFVSSSSALSLTVDDHGNGLAFTRYRIDAAAFSSYSAPFTLKEGSHTLSFQSQDLRDNLEPLQNVAVTADATPPAIQVIFSPQGFIENGSIFISTATSVAFQIQDALAGVAAAQFRIDPSVGDPYQPYVSGFNLTVGTHTLDVRAVDNLGHLRTVAAFVVNVASAAPVGNGQPSSGTLPDGTPVIAAPDPISVVPPSGGETGSGGVPVVQSVSLSPASPVGPGTVTFTVRFSKAMDNTVNPQVSFLPEGSAAPVSVNLASYTGNIWTGNSKIAPAMNSGTALLTIAGAKDASGQIINPSVSTFRIHIVPPAAPVNFAASIVAGVQVSLSWQPALNSGTAFYNLYRSTAPILSRIGLTAHKTGLATQNATDIPSPDVPAAYYAVTAVNALGAESPVSVNASVPVPLTPAITAPAANSTVDISSITLHGIAQAGALIDLSTASAGGTLLTVPVAADRTWSARLDLDPGSYLIAARARSAVTGNVSSPTMLMISASLLPLPPAGFQASAGDTTIILSWTPSPQPQTTGYNIYRDGSSRPLNAAPLPTAQSSYQDLALTNGRSYFYMITSISNNNVESNTTPSIPATPVSGAGWGQ